MTTILLCVSLLCLCVAWYAERLEQAANRESARIMGDIDTRLNEMLASATERTRALDGNLKPGSIHIGPRTTMTVNGMWTEGRKS